MPGFDRAGSSPNECRVSQVTTIDGDYDYIIVDRKSVV